MQIALTSQDKETYKIDAIVLDAVIRENHTLAARVTKHVVEDGATISDHMAAEPESVEMECEVTNTPVRAPGSHANDAKAIGIDIPYKARGPISIRLGPIGNIDPFASNALATVVGYDTDFDRVNSVWSELREIVGKKVVTIVTSLGEYKNMAVEHVSAVRENAISKALRFTVSFVNIATVSNKTTKAPVPAIPAAVPKKRIGKAPPKPEPPMEEVQNSSWAETMLGL
jgi:hypothetical protein